MKTKTLSLALVFMLMLTMLPTIAFASGDPKVDAPQNVAVYEIAANDGQTIGLGLKLTFDQTFLKAVTPVGEDSYGPYCARIYYEFKVDNGSWFALPDSYYDSFWSSSYGTGGSTYNNAFFVYFQPGYGAQNRGEEFFSGFQLMLKKTVVDDEADSYILDGVNHMLEARVRYEMVSAEDYEAAAIYPSAWSAVKWGKGAAVEKPKSFATAPVLSDINVQLSGIDKRPQVKFTVKHPDDVMNAATNPTGLACFRLEVSYDKGTWQHDMTQTVSWLFASGESWTDLPARQDGEQIKIDATAVQLRMRYEWYDGLTDGHAPVNGDGTPTFVSPWSNSIGTNADAWSNASAWATPELEKANQAGLIPDCLKGQDLARDITRAEFAALSVRLYEVMSGKTATPNPQNPFTDTADAEILKAYALGITKGTTPTTFQPNLLIPREQVATMLTRTVQAAKSGVSLDTAGALQFSDDAMISSWAKESVYFMAKHEIIKGVGDNKFAPRNTTAAEQAAGYANATREQSLIIAVRSLEALGK